MLRPLALCAVMTGILLAVIAVDGIHIASPPASTRRILYYEDPMHPAYRSSAPGLAPDCGMALVPVFADSKASPSSRSASTVGIAHVERDARNLYGIEVTRVVRTSVQNHLRLYGRVAADEGRIYRVNLGTEGFVKATANDAIGDHVTKDQHLAVIYSPEFLSVAGGYLSANDRGPGSGGKENPVQAQSSASAQARADRLRILGMSDAQISEISADRRIPEDVYVVSPADGFIISRDISPGMRFEKHAELYRIADLSRVWVLAEVFGQDAASLRPGTAADIVLPESGEHFAARVSHILPEVDPASRATEARLEVANPGFHLRPGMFVDVMLAAPLRAGLTVPVEAVINTGFSQQVFVEVSDGTFQVRQIETGWTVGDRVEVTAGLKEGDSVVSSGAFLVDSETRLHPRVSTD